MADNIIILKTIGKNSTPGDNLNINIDS